MTLSADLNLPIKRARAAIVTMSVLTTAFVLHSSSMRPFGGVVALILLGKAMDVRNFVKTVSFRYPISSEYRVRLFFFENLQVSWLY